MQNQRVGRTMLPPEALGLCRFRRQLAPGVCCLRLRSSDLCLQAYMVSLSVSTCPSLSHMRMPVIGFRVHPNPVRSHQILPLMTPAKTLFPKKKKKSCILRFRVYANPTCYNPVLEPESKKILWFVFKTKSHDQKYPTRKKHLGTSSRTAVFNKNDRPLTTRPLFSDV